ncbi:MAG: transposase [Coxiellaceae bacterium]|nr:transposase [Coxiellaceae bacterium]
MMEGKGKEDWVDNELKTVNLGDKRLDRRLGNILEALGTKPTLSIPSACNVWSETKAAYCFF